jgi:hypothetical protein
VRRNVYQRTHGHTDRRPTPFYTARRQSTLPGREDRHSRGADLFPSRLLIAFAPHTKSCQPLREKTYNSSSLPHVSPSITPQTRVGCPAIPAWKAFLNDHHHRLTHPQRETRTCSFILHSHTYTHMSAHEARTHIYSDGSILRQKHERTITLFLYYTKYAGTSEEDTRKRRGATEDTHGKNIFVHQQDSIGCLSPSFSQL